MARQDTHVAGIDIGTTSVRVIVAVPTDHGDLDVVGIGQAPSKGLRKGVVVNPDSTVEAIRAAVDEAELMSGREVRRAFVGVAGAHVKGLNTRGVVAVARADQKITPDDVKRVLDKAKQVHIPRDREILHVLPQDYTVDEQEGVADPVDMQGSRLEANVHVVTAGATSTQNLITCVNRAGIEVRAMVLEVLAAAECTLTDDEKELGVALVDIGGGTCDLAVFERGAICHVSTLPVGGDHFTNDIAVGLRAPVPDAELLKKKHGHALSSMVPEEAVVEVPSVGGRRPRQLSLQVLSEIIQPRAEEIFGLLRDDVERAGLAKTLNSGVVLSGAASLMPGLAEVAEQVFELPVRRGVPRGIGGLVDVVANPSYATSVGLAAWGQRHGEELGARVGASRLSLGRLGGRLYEWITDIFEPASAGGGARRAAR